MGNTQGKRGKNIYSYLQHIQGAEPSSLWIASFGPSTISFDENLFEAALPFVRIHQYAWTGWYLLLLPWNTSNDHLPRSAMVFSPQGRIIYYIAAKENN